MPDARIRLSGPLFEGDRGAAAGRTFVRDVVVGVTGVVNERVHAFLDRDIVHPTPYYETQIAIVDHAYNDRSVTDRGVIYGPWLEGVSSRNATTRFKGYHAFREAAQAGRQAAPRVMARAAAAFTARMNGGA